MLTLDAALQGTIPALLALLEALPDDSPFRTLDPPQRRQRTLDTLKRVLLRESQVQPLVLVFEDLHWIDAETQAFLNLYSGHDPGVCCRYRSGPTLWLLGFPDQAVTSSQAALALAQQLAHPLSLAIALYWAAILHHLRREAPLTQARAEALTTIGTDQEFAVLSAQAMSLLGWALATSRHGEEGIRQIQQGLAASQATGGARDRPYHLALLAEVSAQGGQTAEGLEVLAESLATLPKSGVRWWEAELYRLRGELVLQHAVAQPEEGEACFQQARSLELRATMSLARLWQQQGKRVEAR